MNISVIVATFGSSEWALLSLRLAIPSARAAEPHEVIAVHEPHGTVCTSRNAGAARATGDFLAFLDGDDELDPGFVGSMRRALEQQQGGDEGLLLTPAVSHTHAARRRQAIFLPERPLSDSNWLVIGTLISRKLFWEIGGFDERDPHGLEDWSLWTRAAAAGATVVKVPEAVYIAHQRRVGSHAVYARSPEYGGEYTRIRRAAWPHLYEQTA